MLSSEHKDIIVDFDDVIGDMSLIVEETLTNFTGHFKSRHDWDVYEIFHHFPITNDEFVQLIIDQKLYENMPPLYNSIRGIRTFAEHGYKIHIVTARGAHPFAHEITEQWLDKYDVPWDSITVSEFGTKKSDHFDNIAPRFAYMFDDHLKNIYDGIDSKKVDHCIVINRRWNRDDPRFVQDINRFDCLGDFADQLFSQKT